MPQTFEEQLNSLMKIYSELETPKENENISRDDSRTTFKKSSRKIPILVFSCMSLFGAFAIEGFSRYLEKRDMNSGPWMTVPGRNKEGVWVLRDIGIVAQELRDATNSYASGMPDVPGLREHALQALASEIDSYDRHIQELSKRPYWNPDFPPERIEHYITRFSELRQQAIAQQKSLEGKTG